MMKTVRRGKKEFEEKEKGEQERDDGTRGMKNCSKLSAKEVT